MRIIAKSTLREFWEAGHGDAQEPLMTWHAVVSHAKWLTPTDVKRQYPSVSFLDNNRAVFNIKGNKYRLIANIDYSWQRIFIHFIGTHAEYDQRQT